MKLLETHGVYNCTLAAHVLRQNGITAVEVGTSIVGFAKHMVPLYSKGSLTNNTNKDRNSLRTDCVGWEINLILRQKQTMWKRGGQI